MAFPKDFTWGVATSSYQIEGAADEDGKGVSIWDSFCKKPGKTWEGNTGDIAIDHYHRYKDDIRLMQDYHIKAYRFSVSWPRILPQGTGRINQKGLGFYDRLVDTMLENRIEPWLNIFHWDYPYELYCRGGWLNPSSPDWFAEFAALLSKHFSDRVKHWMTMNEPQVFIDLGHRIGLHAPGLEMDMPDLLRITHNALLAHGKAVQALRAHAKKPLQIGAAPVGVVHFPATDDSNDINTARKATFRVDPNNLWNNTWFADPIFLGSYPKEGLNAYAKYLPKIPASDLEIIHQPLDFYGVNIYHGEKGQASQTGEFEPAPEASGPPLTTMGWRVTPEAMYWGTRFFYERYRVPLVITENGIATTDWVHLDGKVHDPQRIDFLTRYLKALKRAIDDGIDVRGYFEWSMFDNFEWERGYSQRFGLVYIDHATQARIPKDSAAWYKQVIDTNGASLEE
ncbi:MAG: beta-glucosidase [Anaerolineales bacterium]|nr:beta-glucosidase [Anaerolineales bacterium]